MTHDDRCMLEILALLRAIAELNPPPVASRVIPCDAHSLGQIERAAHLLKMMEAQGIRIAKPCETNRLLGTLAATLSRRGPYDHTSDYDTARATLAGLEAEGLITIDTTGRSRALAILGSALAVRC